MNVKMIFTACPDDVGTNLILVRYSISFKFCHDHHQFCREVDLKHQKWTFIFDFQQ